MKNTDDRRKIINQVKTPHLHHKEIISKNYLPRFVFAALGIFILGLLVSAVMMYLNTSQSLDTNYRTILSILTETRESLMVNTLKISGVFSILVFAGLLLLGIFYTHKIAGPLYRIKLSAKTISEGKLSTKIKFREKDVIHPFAESVNGMTQSYCEKLGTLSVDIRELRERLSEIKSSAMDDRDLSGTVKSALEKDARINNFLKTIKL